MARIPIYQQRVSPNGQGAAANMQGARVISGEGQGFEAIASGLDKIAGAIDRGEQVDFALEKDRIETEGRIWAAKAASQADLDMAKHLQESQKAAPPGASGFTPSYLKGYDEYKGKTEANAPSQFAKQLINSHLERSREAYGKAAMMYEAQEFSRYQGQQVDDGVQMSASLVSANPAWFEREMGKWESTIRGITVPEAAKAKMRELAKNTLVTAAVKGWVDKNPYHAATILEDWSRDEKHAPYAETLIDGNHVRVPIGMADYKQQQQLVEYARQKAEGIRQEASVSLRYETANMEAQAALGVAPTGPMRSEAEFAAAFKNPEVARHEWARYQAAHVAASSTAAMAGKPTAELLQVMQAKPEAGDPDFAVKAQAQEVQARAAAQIVKARTDDPVGYAMQTGDFGLQALDPSKPAAFSEELKKRTAALPVMAAKYGAASVLSKPEASMLAQQVSALPADRRVQQLETIRRSIADDMVYGQVLNSIRPDSPVTALVGNVAAQGAGEAARMIAMGEDLLNPSKGSKATDGGKGSAFPMPAETMMRQAWVDSVGTAYRGYPDAEATAYQAFKAYYAAAASQKGLNDPKASPDDKILREAVKASTGGVMRWKTDLFGNSTPSAPIVLPYGMPEDQFRDRVSAEWLRVREGAGYQKTDVGDIGLYNTGANGEYMVMSGTSWLPGKDGKPIVLRVTPAAWQAAGQIGGR